MALKDHISPNRMKKLQNGVSSSKVDTSRLMCVFIRARLQKNTRDRVAWPEKGTRDGISK